MISIVLPLKNLVKANNGFNDIDRAKLILIPSFEKYFCLDKLFEFIIICPSEDLEIIQNNIKSDKMKIVLYTDEEICDVFPTDSWFRQQAIKLGIAFKVKTDHYFIFDADMCLTRPIKYDLDLFKDGKPVCHGTKYRTHYMWWMESCKILKIHRRLELDNIGPDLTPNIFNRHIVIEMLNYLILTYQEPWSVILRDKACFVECINNNNSIDLAPAWHEYGLYFMYLMTWHKFEDYYYGYKFILGPSIWNDKIEVTDEFLEHTFGNYEHFVVVFQSTVEKLPMKEIYEKIKKHLIL